MLNMLTTRAGKRVNPGRMGKITAAAIALAVALARPAFCAGKLSFPPTRYTILNPATGTAIGHSEYRADETADGATLRGVNFFYDDQVDVETSHIEAGHGGQGPMLVDFDHTFYKADGSILVRGYLDLRSGAATCINNNPGQKTNQSEILSVPHDTWAGASVVVPIQEFLRAGDLGSTQSLHVFSCAPGPKIFAVSVHIDKQGALWPIYGAEAIKVEVQPNFGLITPLIASFIPKIRAWFNPNNGWALLGDESARWYKGPAVMLVKAAPARRPATP
jgi:hypothetical protein